MTSLGNGWNVGAGGAEAETRVLGWATLGACGRGRGAVATLGNVRILARGAEAETRVLHRRVLHGTGALGTVADDLDARRVEGARRDG